MVKAAPFLKKVFFGALKNTKEKVPTTTKLEGGLKDLVVGPLVKGAFCGFPNAMQLNPGIMFLKKMILQK